MDGAYNVTIFPPDDKSALESATTEREDGPRDPISAESYMLFLRTTLLLRFAIFVTGIWTNTLNIRAFYRMGLVDSVTIVFCLISVSDFILLLGGLVDWIIEVMTIKLFGYPPLSFPPEIVGFLISTLTRGLSEITYLSTTFLALQRCLCVVKPLHFKGIFTRLRTFVIMAAIWLFVFLFTLILVVYSSKVEKIFDPEFNASRYVASYIPGREVVVDAYSTTFVVVLNIANQVIVTCCVFVMAHALEKSLRFRQSMTSLSSSSAITKDESQGQNMNNEDQQVVQEKKSVAGSTREKQALIQVTLVSTIFLVCNSIRLAFAFAVAIVPEFDLHGVYYFTFMLCYVIMTIFESINSSVNFFVYYKYNSKFRKVCFRSNKEGHISM